ncbi:MAG TPA: superoxide dismutase family protein [Candidatus Sulfotelmatobacter sp.]|nr:superoxide dismutase family protein [Candidatus Sulfotelmatobacter sp.]
MKRLAAFAFGLSLVLILSAASSAAKTVVELKDAQGKSVGTVIIWNDVDGTGFEVGLHDLAPGEHGIHIHQNAKCEAPDFKSAGPHFNPGSKKHGFESPDGHHAGDMKNVTVDAQGKAHLRFVDKDVTYEGNDSHSLFSNGGTAIVIHAKADDYKTDPSGNSGDRIACGVITK